MFEISVYYIGLSSASLIYPVRPAGYIIRAFKFSAGCKCISLGTAIGMLLTSRYSFKFTFFGLYTPF
jgi:hypothetical protein